MVIKPFLLSLLALQSGFEAKRSFYEKSNTQLPIGSFTLICSANLLNQKSPRADIVASYENNGSQIKVSDFFVEPIIFDTDLVLPGNKEVMTFLKDKNELTSQSIDFDDVKYAIRHNDTESILSIEGNVTELGWGFINESVCNKKCKKTKSISIKNMLSTFYMACAYSANNRR